MPTILKDKVTVSHGWGTYSFNDPASLVDWPGAIDVRIDDLPGWDNSPDLNVIKVPRGVGDGSYIASKFPHKDRMIIVAGYIVAMSRTALDNLWSTLMIQGFPLDMDITFTRFGPVPKYVTARLAGPIELTQYQGSEGALRFETILLCADPFKYDAVNTISGSAGVAGVSSGGRVYPRTYPLIYNITASGSGNSLTVYNSGSVNTFPISTIHGPLPAGWRLENGTTGAQLAFAVDLASTDVLVINHKQRNALLNGAPINGLLSGDWWPLIPRTNVIRLFGNYDAAASFSLSAKSAWR